MNCKHTPLIRLDAARRAYEVAQGACVHWEYESGSDHECCLEMADAARELSLARKAVHS